LDVTRPWREADLERAESGHLVTELERISPDTALSERLMLGLRLREGVDLRAAATETGAEAWTPARLRAVDKLVSRGRLRLDGDHLRIPKESWLFADGVIAELL
jgi:oxygen-independent coproporphyrinogen-3 oxidase